MQIRNTCTYLEALQLAAELAMLTMPSNFEGCDKRCVVPDAESFVLDQIMCLEDSTYKQKKRLERILFVLKYFHQEFKHKTLARVRHIIELIRQRWEKENNAIEDIERLFAECKVKRNSSGICFDKQSPDQYKIPLKQVFNDACKCHVNKDGKVYDIFAAVVTIAFNTMLNEARKSHLRQDLLQSAKLIFKGGAAIGKFLFQANPQLWDSMIDMDRNYVIDTFINGGDNDTCIMFAMNKSLENYSTEAINFEIGSIIYDMQICMLDIVERYFVDFIVSKYLRGVVGQTVRYDNHEFKIKQRPAASFAITDKDEQQLELLMFMSRGRKRVFGSLSYLEFPNAKGKLMKFHLARLKAGYKAHLNRHQYINCYGELLDVSAVCIDSALTTTSSYKYVDISVLWRGYI